MGVARIEPEADFRVPSGYPRCRRPYCTAPPVADMRRRRWDNTRRRNTNARVDAWWAYCAAHLRDYGRELRDGRVWWVG